MNERLAQIMIIHKDMNNYGDLQPGQMSLVKDSIEPDLWIIACPLCSGLGELRNHQVIENEDGTVTVSPSLVCNGVIYDNSGYHDCPAHYFIERNHIRWV
jgi:hypothetical protein